MFTLLIITCRFEVKDGPHNQNLIPLEARNQLRQHFRCLNLRNCPVAKFMTEPAPSNGLSRAIRRRIGKLLSKLVKIYIKGDSRGEIPSLDLETSRCEGLTRKKRRKQRKKTKTVGIKDVTRKAELKKAVEKSAILFPPPARLS